MTLEDLFPGLRSSAYRITSPFDKDYNCIAWSLGEASQWLWPGHPNDDCDWPAEIRRERTLAAFQGLFEWFGFGQCDNEDYESAFDKAALFADSDNLPTLAARQLASGKWTSKLGKSEDIEHDLHALEGDIYGTVVRIFRQPITPP